MKPYSQDLRERIVDAYDRGEGSIRELARRFSVSPTTVQEYLNRRRRTGGLAPSPHGGGPSRTLQRRHERALMALRRKRNDRTDDEYARLLLRRMGIRVSRRTINRTWQRLGVTRKKKVLHASEQERPDVQRARRAFCRRAHGARGRRFIFLDEFGFNLGMTRRYARACRGERAVGHAPLNADPNVTLTMGLTQQGVLVDEAFEGGTNGLRYQSFLRDRLAPELRPGDVVVADQLGAHRTRLAREIIEARGAEYWLLPAYSPDLSPVEEAGSKVKAIVRGAEPRRVRALYRTINRAIGSVSSHDARGWFSHRAWYLDARNRPVRPPL